MQHLSKHEIWEETLFGNVNKYAAIVKRFPDVAEKLATPSGGKPPAKEVVRCILRGSGNFGMSMAEELVRYTFKSPRANQYGFREWLQHEIMNLMEREPPEALIEEVVELLPYDLDEPDELPVQWPERLSRDGHSVQCKCAVCKSKRS
jgi:hypothetical protein